MCRDVAFTSSGDFCVPDTPERPDTPDNPEVPDIPGIPENPDHLEFPVVPDYSGSSGLPRRRLRLATSWRRDWISASWRVTSWRKDWISASWRAMI